MPSSRHWLECMPEGGHLGVREAAPLGRRKEGAFPGHTWKFRTQDCSQRETGQSNEFERSQGKEDLKEVSGEHEALMRTLGHTWHLLLHLVWGRGHPMNCANPAGNCC